MSSNERSLLLLISRKGQDGIHPCSIYLTISLVPSIHS